MAKKTLGEKLGITADNLESYLTPGGFDQAPPAGGQSSGKSGSEGGADALSYEDNPNVDPSKVKFGAGQGEEEEEKEDTKKKKKSQEAKESQEEENEEEEEEDDQGEEEDGKGQPSGKEGEEDEEEEINVISTLKERLGYASDQDFDNSVEGVSEYFEAAMGERVQEELNNFFSNYPDIKEYYNHIQAGGSLDTFRREAQGDQMANIDINEADDSVKRSVIMEDMRAKGNSERVINKFMETAEEDLDVYAKEAQQSIQQRSKKAKKQREQAKKDQQETRKKQRKEAQNMVKKGDLGSLKIPKADVDKFWKYMYQPDNTGYTERQRRLSNLSVGDKLAMEYALWKNFNLGKQSSGETKKADFSSLGSRRNRIKDQGKSGEHKQTNNGKKVNLRSVFQNLS